MGGSAPYEAMAPFYDRIMAHVDYGAWARHLRALWRRFGGAAPPRRILELAAGTCPFAVPPLFPGAFMLHSDASHAMLGAAAAGRPPIRVACDARALAVRGPFDLLIMVYDSLNYLRRGEEVLRALRQARTVLRPGGLFVFDVTTAQCSRRHFADTVDREEFPGAAYVRRSLYDPKTRLQWNTFHFYLPGSENHLRVRDEIHQQRIYPAAMLRRLAIRAGFRVRACLAGFGFRPGNDRSERLHFVLQRP